MDNMDYESRMELERKKKSKTQLISLLFVIVILLGGMYFYTDWKKGTSQFEKKEKALCDSVMDIYEAEKIMEPEDKTYTFPDKSITNFTESTLKGGVINLYSNGNVEFAIYDSKWCATKSKTSGQINVVEYEEGKCVIR